jgi:type VI protein secretion system component VasK
MGARLVKGMSVLFVFAIAVAASVVAGVPGQLPNVAMGWVLLFHIERAAALLGVIGLVLLIGWRAVQGELPIKLGNVEYEAKRAAADAEIVAEELEHRIRILEVLAGLRRPEELDADL